MVAVGPSSVDIDVLVDGAGHVPPPGDEECLVDNIDALPGVLVAFLFVGQVGEDFIQEADFSLLFDEPVEVDSVDIVQAVVPVVAASHYVEVVVDSDSGVEPSGPGGVHGFYLFPLFCCQVEAPEVIEVTAVALSSVDEEHVIDQNSGVVGSWPETLGQRLVTRLVLEFPFGFGSMCQFFDRLTRRNSGSFLLDLLFLGLIELLQVHDPDIIVPDIGGRSSSEEDDSLILLIVDDGTVASGIWTHVFCI